ncbi:MULTISPECIES: glycosyltransferase family 2 protein [Methanobacterium]|jgi:glycosyltransferase involved in cell wall biosynthesis|uniref:Glycosyltransferase family 2 protein n=1 Tax=Methanobacterium veterum TaxID=408577 RepID=A0A9E5A3T2_9EURY|nr:MULTISPECIES: glycosyltransferase family 2 protein [Methanobacterium]MCZ3367490.1 glycosyltransferase family 2 protein [Methanobacterium veterum]MCZ3373362.1 glycosyltransferase family 2 protein [Methanobacterium veterum]
MAKITAILPAYNEELCISSVILCSKKYVDKVIVVDDGSTDNTAKIAKLAGAQVISHFSNKGKGAALKTGFEAAKESEIIVTLDSDGQHNPKEIPKLITPIINGEADIVNGSRYINGNKKDTPSYRRIGQSILDKITNLGSGLNSTDSQSGFRAFARYTIPAFRFSCTDFGIESEMLTDASNVGLRVKEVEIGVRYDTDSSTKNPINHGVGVLIKVINDLQFQRPLFYFALPGTIVTLAGIILCLMFFGNYMSSNIAGNITPSASYGLAPTILAIMMTLIGGFLVLTGILLDSMGKMIDRIIISSQNGASISKSAEGIDFNKLKKTNIKSK